MESINDYLKLKDEELALSISAQRVDGYEVEGITEEVDKVNRVLCKCWGRGRKKVVGPSPQGARGFRGLLCLEFARCYFVMITFQFVREICQFDLACPIKGVGPGVVRKLLLEESLKIRGRKDSKVGRKPALGPGGLRVFNRLVSALTCCGAAGGGGSALLRCSPDDQIPEERRAAEGGAASPGPGQNLLRGVKRRL